MNIKEMFEKIRRRLNTIFSGQKQLPETTEREVFSESMNDVEKQEKSGFAEQLKKQTDFEMQRKENERNQVSLPQAIYQDLQSSIQEMIEGTLKSKGVRESLLYPASTLLKTAAEDILHMEFLPRITRERNERTLNLTNGMIMRDFLCLGVRAGIDQTMIDSLQTDVRNFILKTYGDEKSLLADSSKLEEAKKNGEVHVTFSFADTHGYNGNDSLAREAFYEEREVNGSTRQVEDKKYRMDRSYIDLQLWSLPKNEVNNILQERPEYQTVKHHLLFYVRDRLAPVYDAIEISPDGRSVKYGEKIVECESPTKIEEETREEIE